MSGPAQPFMKFYPQDWRADEKLRLCSLAARGLWMEMLALMHRSERYGHLVINGSVPTHEQLAVQVGASPSEVTALLAELEGAGVFSRSSSGSLYSRRMTRDAKKAKIARQNGKAGGNPSLRNKTGNSASDKGQDKAEVKGGLKPQIPEARSQRPDNRPPPTVRIPRDLAAVMQAGSFVSPPGDAALLKAWYEAGARLEEDILPVVRRVTGEVLGRTGKAPFKLQLFDQAVRAKVDEDEREVRRLKRIAEEGRRSQAAAGG